MGCRKLDILDKNQHGLKVVHKASAVKLKRCADAWRWEYYIKDHLGNIRISFSDLNDDGEITVALDETNEILEENHYYPFGLKQNGPWLKRKDQGFKNKYSFNSNESIPFAGYLDFHARTFDPSIGRFLQMDPLADVAPDWNAYRYGFNNPLLYIDPDGLFETKKDAEKHAEDNGIKTGGFFGFFRANRIKEQDNGSFAIENKKERSITQDFGEDIGVATGLLAGSSDVIEMTDKEPSIMDKLVNGPQLIQTHRDGSTTQRPAFDGGTVPGPGKAVKSAASAARGIRTLTKTIKEHLNKLINYRGNPDAFDNLGKLKNAPEKIRSTIIKGRTKKLQREIRKLRNERKKLKQ